jgi:hypothetical protein
MKNFCLILVLSFQLYRFMKRMEKDRLALATASFVELSALMWLLNEVW